MYQFSKISLENLESCHPDLQLLAHEVIKHFDIRVSEGHRGEEEQNKYFNDGSSKLRWPHSKHNKLPSEAVHFLPYPIDWHDYQRFYFLGGLVTGLAAKLGIKIRWGGDWSMDGDLWDQSFMDLAHFELVPS